MSFDAASPYAARPWLKHYDYWVRPHMTYPGRPLYEILSTTAVEMPDAQATAFLGATLTFGEIKQRTDRLAAALRAARRRQGRSRRHHAAQLPAVHHRGVRHLRLGAVVVNINPIYTARELLNVADDSGIKVLITLDRLAPLALDIARQDRARTRHRHLARRVLGRAAPPPPRSTTRWRLPI